MSERHSTEPAPRSKPTKPSPDFPLFPHANGSWAKKIRGRMHYFGKWEEPDAALEKYLAEKDDLHAGRTVRPDAEETEVVDVANAFLIDKKSRVDSGELSPRTFDDYKATCDLIVSHFGKGRVASDLRQDEFAALRKQLAKKWGPHRLGKTIQCVRCVFRFAHKSGLIGDPTSMYGAGFERPSKKTLRLHWAAQRSARPQPPRALAWRRSAGGSSGPRNLRPRFARLATNSRSARPSSAELLPSRAAWTSAACPAIRCAPVAGPRRSSITARRDGCISGNAATGRIVRGGAGARATRTTARRAAEHASGRIAAGPSNVPAAASGAGNS